DPPDRGGPERPGAKPPDAKPPAPVPPEPLPRAEDDVFFQKTFAELDDGRFFTRKAALERLATMKPNDQRAKVARKLVELTKSGTDPRFRTLAVTALGVWGSEDE